MARLTASMLLGLALTGPSLVAAESAPVVSSRSGIYRGGLSEYVEEVNVFKGIRFSNAATGSLRWTHSPEPTIDLTTIVNATEFAPPCPQLRGGEVVGDEDCLFLNVWVPEGFTNTSNYPVLFFAYGGRFEEGATSDVTYDGSALAKQGIVVVTMNYRLGALGWLAHPELSAESAAADNHAYNGSGNWGIMDQQAALHWTYENIASYGGNASAITVAGQSAGSALALDLLFTSTSTNSLYHRVIAESGARAPNDPLTGSLATSHLTQEQAYAIGEKFLAILNVSSIAEARNLSLATILRADLQTDTTFDGTAFAGNQAYMNPPVWRPTIDGWYFPISYEEALATGAHADVPVLTGNNKDESGASPSPAVDLASYTANNTAIFAPLGLLDTFNELFPATTDAEAVQQTNNLYRNQSLISTWNWANAWAAGGAQSNVYTYYWTHAPPGQDQGAFHGSELNYVFGNLAYSATLTGEKLNYTSEDYVISNRMLAYWVNFIKTGDPNGGNLTYWAPSTNTSKTTQLLGDGWGSVSVGSDEAIDFFDEFFAQEPAY